MLNCWPSFLCMHIQGCTFTVAQFKQYSVLARPTNAQHIYINNIPYIVSTPTCFDATTSSSGSFILLHC